MRTRSARRRARGDKLVLLTSSSRYASEMAIEEFGLHDALCQRYEVQDGRLTGAGRQFAVEQVVRPQGFP